MCRALARRDGGRRGRDRRRAQRRHRDRAARAGPHLLRVDHVLGRRRVGERRGAREALSSELWETLNTTYREVGSRARAGTGPPRHEFFGWVRDRAAACNGIVDATMSRDDGWRFSRARPQPRARRHDRPAALRPLRRRVRPHRMDHDAAQLLGVRGLPARPTGTRSTRDDGGRVPAARPALPTVGVPRAHHRRATPRRARPALGAAPGDDDEARRRLGPRPRRARVPPPRRGDGRPPASCSRGSSTSAPTSTRRSPRRYFRETRVIEWSV